MTDKINFSYTEILKRKIASRLKNEWNIEHGYPHLKGLKKETLEDINHCLEYYENEKINNSSVNYGPGYAITMIRAYRSLEIYEKEENKKRQLKELEELEELDIKE
tara:strand:- start:436 stop:753 length:318 start_codon:yes stop_codon:yes gene_type:complete